MAELSLVKVHGSSWDWPACQSTGQHTNSRASLVTGLGIVPGLASM